MLQGNYEPYKNKTPLQAGGSAVFGSIVFGIIIAAVPSFSPAWSFAGFALGVIYVTVSLLCKLESTKNNLLIKFAPGCIVNIYILILSMRAFSYLLSNNLLGAGLPLVSFALVAVFSFFDTKPKTPKTIDKKHQLFLDRLNKAILIFIPIAGVLGASFGMITARTGQTNLGMFIMGTIAYVLSLGIAYSLFSQISKTKKQNG